MVATAAAVTAAATTTATTDGMMRPSQTAKWGGRRRHTFGVTLAALAALAATSCSNASEASVVSVKAGEAATSVAKPAKSTATAGATAAAVASSTAAPAGPVAPAAPAPAFDPVAVLGQALDALAPAYDLATTITYGNKIEQTFTGRVVGVTSQLSITRDNATIEYLQVPPKAWSRDQGGDWTALDGQVPGQSALDVLRQPAQSQAVSEDAAGRGIHASYASETFGLAAGGTVEVDVVAGADGSVSVSYPVAVGGKSLLVVEKLVPAPDAAPFTNP